MIYDNENDDAMAALRGLAMPRGARAARGTLGTAFARPPLTAAASTLHGYPP